MQETNTNDCNEEGKENQPLISEDYQQCKYYYDRLISILNLTLLTRDLEKSGAILQEMTTFN